MKKLVRLICCLSCFGMVACAPEVGSEAWCKKMDDKAKGDWTANEAKDYAKHCIMRKFE